MLRWNRTLIRATAAAAVAGLVLTTVAGAVQLPGPALVALVLLGIVVAVVAVVVSSRER